MTDAFNNNGINFSHIIDKLDYYYGDRNKFEWWKTQMEKFFSFHKISVDKQTLIAIEYFHEWIEDWVQPLINKYFANGIDDENIFNKFKDFVKKMTIIFGFINNKPLAEQHFLVLSQKGLMSNYVAIFQKYIARIEWNNKTK